ncbi:unnamed protein product [Dicrocoelium dendriticum]|nr:unnamed protein product [Dicrocoelium dendriticum]
MPPASVVISSNPPHLSNNSFLVKLAVDLNVTSIPLAIFLLILICIACILFVVVLILIARSCIRRKFIAKRKRKPAKGIYLDEIAGAVLGDVENTLGSLEYSLEYDLQSQQLKVGVIQAHNLQTPAGVDALDAYVNVNVYKQKGGKNEPVGKPQHTIRRHSQNPVWHQSFCYDVRERELQVVFVVFEMFDYDSIGQDRSIGILKVTLKDLDESDYAGQIFECTGWLKPGTPMVDGVGELCVGLSYYPQHSRIDVTIYEARQLNVADKLSKRKGNRLLINVELQDKKGRRLSSNETKPKSEIINPYFNSKMSFPSKNVELTECAVVCQLKRHGKLGGNKTLAYCILGFGSTISTGSKQWEEMLRNPSKTHVMWHTLIQRGKDSAK